MAQLPMYAAMVNSPGTELAADINATDTEITVLDASKLPAAPNLVTVGGDETAETIRYTGKTGNTLTGCTRGFEGTAKGWAVGTQAARNHTAYDYEAGRANIADVSTRVDNIVIPDGTTAQKGIVQLSDATGGSRSTVAATEKAVGLAFQAGVERKAEVVASLNSIGISASTSETWDQLIPKIAAVIRATGTANVAQVLSGATFSNQSTNGLVGAMPDNGALGTITPGISDQTIPIGYTSGGNVLGDPDLIASNIKSGVNIFGVVGNFAGSISPGAGPIWRRTTYITASQSTPLEIVGIVFNVSGTIRISFGLRSDSSGGGRAQIYKNGVAFGTLRSNNSTSVTTYTEDITFASGDRISVYLWTGGAGSGTLETITYGSTLFTIAKE